MSLPRVFSSRCRSGKNAGALFAEGQTRWHRLAHRLGWNTGRIVAVTDSRGRVWIGFECDRCGEVNGAHPMRGLP